MLQGAGNDLEFLILPPPTPGASVVGASVCVRVHACECACTSTHAPEVDAAAHSNHFSLYIEAASLSH